MLVVGDSRVRELEHAAQDKPCIGWRIEFLHAPGVNLDGTINLIEEWKKNQYPDRPRMIVIVSILHDLIERFRRPDGRTSLRMAAGIKHDGVYPALTGFEKKLTMVQNRLKGWWRELEIIWMNPYPIDVRRWVEKQMNGRGSLPYKEIMECHQITYDFAYYVDRANNLGSRIRGIGDSFIPWFVFWNDKKRSELNYNNFLKEFEAGRKFGWINANRSIDGLLPSRSLCRQTLDMFFRKAWQAVPPPRTSDVPVLRGINISNKKTASASSECAMAVADPTIPVWESEKIPSCESLKGPSCVPCADVEGDLDVLMKRIHLVSLLENQVSGIPENVPIPTGDATGINIVSNKVMTHGDNKFVDFVKTIYPCGHSLPFNQTENTINLKRKSLCPTCKRGWSGNKFVRSSYHFINLQ